MRIVTLNLWGGRFIQELENWLPEIGADIYCFQEVFSSPIFGDRIVKGRNGDFVQADLLSRLKKILPQYKSFFSPGSKGYINDDTWVGSDIEYGIAIFIRADWAVTKYGADIVHGPFRHENKGVPPLSRSAQIIRCVTPKGPFIIGNMHGLWEPDGKHDTDRRVLQARKFEELIAKTSDPNDPVVLCGDFNLLPDSATFNMMYKEPLRNLILDYRITSTRTLHCHNDIRFADYILVNNRLDVSEFTVPQNPILSDHCPLILDAEIMN